MHRPRFKLRTKIIAWSFVPTAIILLVVALTIYFAYQQVTEEVVITRDEELTRLSASELSASFEDYVDRLTNLARLPDVYRGDLQRQRAAFAGDRNKLIFFDAGVYLLNNLGKVEVADREEPDVIGQDWSDRTFFRSMVRAQSLVFSNVAQDGPQGEEVISLAVPIQGERNEFLGVIVGMFRLDPAALSPFYGTILRLRIGGSGNTYLVDGNEVVIYASEAGLIGKTLSSHPVSEPAGNGEVGALRTRSLGGQDIVAGYAPVPRTDWTLIVEERWSELIRPTLRYQQFLLFLLALGVIIPTTVVMIGVQRITRPLADFIAAAQRIAGGDFHQRIQVATGDEMEELADQFNTMTRRLHDSYETLEQRVLQRTHELTALNSIAAIVSRSLDLEQILPDALTKTIEVMGMDAGAVFRLDSETGLLTLVTQQGLSPEFIALIEKFPVGTSLTSVTVQSKYPAARLVADYPPGALKDRLSEGGWKTAVSIPLLAQEHVLGAINATSRNEIEFSPEELAVPAAIGQQIGIAMDNARLYEQSVSYARQMEIERHAAVEARAAAERASAAKSDFLANVSHELRTPLFSINGFAHLVKKRLHERIFPNLNGEDNRQERTMAQINENLDIILVEGQRLTTMINSLLDLAKIEAGNMEWEIRKFSLASVIRQAAALTDSLFENSSLALNLDLPDPLPPVTGDPEKTLQVLINLISNAVKFSQRGMITIRACQSEGEIVTSVNDQGIGIDPTYYDEIFQKFTQVGETLTGKPKGTGLGLAISRQIIERLGGRIWVESEPGRGSTFSFSLPISDLEGEVYEI